MRCGGSTLSGTGPHPVLRRNRRPWQTQSCRRTPCSSTPRTSVLRFEGHRDPARPLRGVVAQSFVGLSPDSTGRRRGGARCSPTLAPLVRLGALRPSRRSRAGPEEDQVQSAAHIPKRATKPDQLFNTPNVANGKAIRGFIGNLGESRQHLPQFPDGKVFFRDCKIGI